MTRDDSAKFAKLLQNVIKTQGFGNNPKIKINKGSGTGESYISVNTAVEVFTDEKVLKLFVKTVPKEEKVISEAVVKDLFAREIFFYKRIYPEFSRFQAERNVTDPFVDVPKCYVASDEVLEEAVVLEDLKDAGYVLYDKNVEMDDEHLAFIFKRYARFHAVSYAMKSQEPQLYVDLSSKWSSIMGVCLKATGVDVLFTHYARELNNIFDPVKDERILKRIQGLPDVLRDAGENWEQFCDGYSVLAHGDCWYNNFMFKYEENFFRAGAAGEPMKNETSAVEVNVMRFITSNISPEEDPARRVLTDVKILDWQGLHVVSPVLDVCHFFYGVATKETMSNLDSYMKLYHKTLSKNIEEMGGDPNELFPYSAFEDHWKRFSRYGLMNAFGIQKIRFTDLDDLVKIHELIGKGKTIGEAFLYEIKKEGLYRERIRDVVEHFVDNGFI